MKGKWRIESVSAHLNSGRRGIRWELLGGSKRESGLTHFNHHSDGVSVLFGEEEGIERKGEWVVSSSLSQ